MNELEVSWIEESQRSMHGWDFSHLTGRWQVAELPWDYPTLVKNRMKADDQWLDIDTGGGELMRQFNHSAELTTVTEGWAPNIDLLRQTMVPAGVQLYPDPTEQLVGVPAASFDLVTNSHGAMPIERMATVLKSGGYLVTEQVGATNNFDLSRFFNEHYQPAYPDNQLLSVVTQLQAAGFEILKADSAYVKMEFMDIGAIVYYATVIPWEFPNFDVQTMLPKLRQLQRLLDVTGKITTFEDRFMVVARKR
ncbi:SAM-dependent methyltransferase [Lactiplantibacillus herbarum]|uniref:SAM-dependent methyltransferase n=1 Tax=Lactiplantibacillus herbarum TaxID=1670446 RepID=UPI00064FD941|nr:SAM-dependent methyltransferase [Lactiplantibacillus herbarum]